MMVSRQSTIHRPASLLLPAFYPEGISYASPLSKIAFQHPSLIGYHVSRPSLLTRIPRAAFSLPLPSPFSSTRRGCVLFMTHDWLGCFLCRPEFVRGSLTSLRRLPLPRGPLARPFPLPPGRVKLADVHLTLFSLWKGPLSPAAW